MPRILTFLNPSPESYRWGGGRGGFRLGVRTPRVCRSLILKKESSGSPVPCSPKWGSRKAFWEIFRDTPNTEFSVSDSLKIPLT